ncbi:MAG: hypothetical protein RR994_05070, partial [Clostridia bacterium]
SMELAANVEQRNLMENQHADTTTADTSELNALRAKVQPLEKENEQLSAKIKQITTELEQLKSEKRQNLNKSTTVQDSDDLQVVGAICQAAYADMALVKQQASDEVYKFADKFAMQADKSAEHVRETIAQIENVKKIARESFLSSVEDILMQFEVFTNEVADLDGAFSGISAVKEELQKCVVTLSDDIHTSENAESSNTEDDAYADLPPILAKAMYERVSDDNDDTKQEEAPVAVAAGKEDLVFKPKTTTHNEKDDAMRSGRIIGMSVSVNPKDLFDR